MTKTLTEHLQAIKDGKTGIFVPYIMAGDHEQGLDGLFDTIQLLDAFCDFPVKKHQSQEC